MISLQEFWDKLSSHDWYYPMSDDGRSYHAGKDSESKLLSLAKESEEHQALYDAWVAHKWSGDPWGTEQQPRPERPEDSSHGD